MRWMLLLLALALGAGSVYFSRFSTTAYRGYSSEQLSQLGKAYETAASSTAATAEASLSLHLLREEQRRRILWPGLGAAAVVCLALALVLRGSGAQRSSPEEDRLVAALGSPELAVEGQRQKAAKLLGVAVDAPPAVVEAALAAQLQSRDVSRMDGLAPDLRKLAERQREELVQAKDLLTRRR